MRLIGLAACGLLFGEGAFAHGGGLNAQGCHNERKTGGYHCHRSSYTPSASVVSKNSYNAGAALLNNQQNENSVQAVPNPTNTTNFVNSLGGNIQDDNVFAAQVVLKKNGCYSGSLDGVLGAETIYAIKLFQANLGKQITGELSENVRSEIQSYHGQNSVCN